MTASADLVRLVRNGFPESLHRGCVAVAAPDGTLVDGLGDPEAEVFPRSAIKPFQALATLTLLDEAGASLDDDGLAIACASHTGSDEHQIEAAHLLALAGLDEDVLQTPPALPDDVFALRTSTTPTPLAHNCSGKHAAFLYACRAAGADPAHYLDVEHALQQRIRAVLADVAAVTITGPGVDGCGAPAWRMPLRGLAVAFARLAAGRDPRLERIRAAMVRRPDLVAGPGIVDTELMRSDARVVAKRGAEGVLAAGYHGADGTVGVAVKVADGALRAATPVVATVLAAFGAAVPPALRRPPVLGGGREQGAFVVDDHVLRVGRTREGRP